MTIGRQPPGPADRWPLGQLGDFIRDRPQALLDLHAGWGDMVRFKLMRRTYHLVSDPGLIAEVLINQQDKFIKNTGFWPRHTDIFGNGLLASHGAEWRRHRKLAAPAFHPRTLEHYTRAFQHGADKQIAQWQVGEARDVHDALMQMTAEIVIDALFGQSPEDTRLLVQHVKILEHQLALRLKRLFWWMDRLPTPENLRFRQSLRVIERELSRFIAAQAQGSGNPSSLLAAMMSARFDDGTSLSAKGLRDELITFFLAGHDTTAITLSWTLFLLSQHDEYWPRLRAEWRACAAPPAAHAPFADRPLTKGVIFEALRLFPPAYMFGREATEALNIGPWRVERGDSVVVSPWVLGRCERWFEAPLAFRPERWTAEFEQRLPRFAFVPFGGGPRICIGQGFALLEAAILLQAIGERFQPICTDPASVEPQASITLPPRGGLMMQLKPVSNPA